MPLIEALDPVEPLRPQVHTLPVPLDERAAEPPAEREARHVARQRGAPDQAHERDELHLSAGGHHAADHDRRLPRDHQPDEGGRLRNANPATAG